jgi:integrase
MTDLIKTLKDKTARIKLAPRQKGKAYFATIEKGIQLGYRPCAGDGTWVLRYRKGGEDWQRDLGTAADHVQADGSMRLDFAQAHARAMLQAAAGKDAAPAGLAAPATVADAVGAYRADLQARGKSDRNADTAARHLDATLLAKPVALLTHKDMADFRKKLLVGRSAATVNRVTTCLKAALSHSQKADRERITNAWTWTDGLEPIAGAAKARNQVLAAEDIRRAVAAAYEDSTEFGLLVELAAVTGARYSQLAAIRVCDLLVERSLVMVPSSNKGRGKKQRPAKPRAISRTLALKLQQAAADRAPEAPLLTKPRGSKWLEGDQGERFARLVEKLDLRDRNGVPATMYALRHSSITSRLLAGVPPRVVADMHDTSLVMIERTYSAQISDHADALLRQGQIEIEPALKVVA